LTSRPFRCSSIRSLIPTAVVTTSTFHRSKLAFVQ
jgi:hypothetical protein